MHRQYGGTLPFHTTVPATVTARTTTNSSQHTASLLLQHPIQEEGSTSSVSDTARINEARSACSGGELVAMIPADEVALSRQVNGYYQCPVCCKEFYDKKDCRRHYMIHTGEKPFSCPYCQYRSNRGSSLSQHIATRHTQHWISNECILTMSFAPRSFSFYRRHREETARLFSFMLS